MPVFVTCCPKQGQGAAGQHGTVAVGEVLGQVASGLSPLELSSWGQQCQLTGSPAQPRSSPASLTRSLGQGPVCLSALGAPPPLLPTVLRAGLASASGQRLHLTGKVPALAGLSHPCFGECCPGAAVPEVDVPQPRPFSARLGSQGGIPSCSAPCRSHCSGVSVPLGNVGRAHP